MSYSDQEIALYQRIDGIFQAMASLAEVNTPNTAVISLEAESASALHFTTPNPVSFFYELQRMAVSEDYVPRLIRTCEEGYDLSIIISGDYRRVDEDDEQDNVGHECLCISFNDESERSSVRLGLDDKGQPIPEHNIVDEVVLGPPLNHFMRAAGLMKVSNCWSSFSLVKTMPILTQRSGAPRLTVVGR